jgi:hypothetical protein
MVKEARKRIPVMITVRKSNKATADAENIALLTEFSQYTGRTPYLLSGILARILLKSHDGCFLVLDCEDLFYTLYPLNFPTNKSRNVLSQGNVGAKDRA